MVSSNPAIEQTLAFKGKNNYLKKLASKIKAPFTEKAAIKHEAEVDTKDVILESVYNTLSERRIKAKECVIEQRNTVTPESIKMLIQESRDELAKFAAKKGYKPL